VYNEQSFKEISPLHRFGGVGVVDLIFFDSKFSLYLYVIMKIDYIIYSVQHSIGIQPDWETKLIESDTHLKTYKRWMGKDKVCKKKCDELYHNRLNFLKGWLK